MVEIEREGGCEDYAAFIDEGAGGELGVDASNTLANDILAAVPVTIADVAALGFLLVNLDSTG